MRFDPHLAVTTITVALLCAGCATTPVGPSVLVIPGTGKSLAQFQSDELNCRQYAQQQVALQSGHHADPTLRDAAVGTALGTIAGAALGGRQGVGAGAGAGLLFGSLIGSDEARISSAQLQRSYDHAFIQCMYASGHQVPAGQLQQPAASTAPAPPPPPPLVSPAR